MEIYLKRFSAVKTSELLDLDYSADTDGVYLPEWYATSAELDGEIMHLPFAHSRAEAAQEYRDTYGPGKIMTWRRVYFKGNNPSEIASLAVDLVTINVG